MFDLLDEPALRILVVAEDPLARAGLAALLVESGCEIAGQIGGSEDVVEQAGAYHSDVVLWDLGWDFEDEADPQLDLLADLSEARVPCVVLLLHPSGAKPAWIAGARSMLPRDATAAELTAALQATSQGLVVLHLVLAHDLVSTPEADITRLVETLTPRETEVLQLLADGLTNKAIAQALGISEHTVKFHVNAILSKLHAESRTEAVVRAARLGLLLL